MSTLRYFATASLDGYVADSSGAFDWAAPDAEMHAFVNDQVRTAGTWLLGRRMYQTMLYWENADTSEQTSAVERDFTGIWRSCDKIVYSTTLAAPSSTRTRLEPRFDPARVRDLKTRAEGDLTIGGATLAGEALRAGLVDVVELLVVPWVIGGGLSWLPADLRLPLELVDERRFASGAVYLRYAIMAGR
ncbi:MAG TPA: dihydrofolate reductase family protein [Microlunatus sp.]|nr:dihydrofolate reductase family protein [Microlunatus sp.]